MVKIVLLDLNSTYVENTSVHLLPHTYNIQAERYRSWLTQVLRDHYVIMLTVRPVRHQEETVARIQQLEGWIPNEAYFSSGGMRAPEAKERMLRRQVYPRHGTHRDKNRYIALESNTATRAMYARHGIPSYTQQMIYEYPHVFDIA